MLDKLTVETFQPLLNETFIFAAEGIEEPFLLAEAKLSRYASSYPKEWRVPFSLTFHGPIGGRFRQQHLYRISHEKLPAAFEVLVVPIGETPERAIIFEVVFG